MTVAWRRSVLMGTPVCSNTSSARLMRLITALGQDVDITITDGPRNRARAQGRIRVVSDAA